jgi:hypothetical protein
MSPTSSLVVALFAVLAVLAAAYLSGRGRV